jgi:hypothetical protein
MDGYAITETPEEAFDAFGSEGVRYAAELDTGEGFLAFDGPIPVEKATIYCNVDENEFWWFKVKRIAEAKVKRYKPGPVYRPGPMTETFGLFTVKDFMALPSVRVKMASPLVGGLILAVTTGAQTEALWSAIAKKFRDVRVNEGELVYA